MKLEQRKNNRIILSVPIQYKVYRLENLEKDVLEQALNFKAEIQDLSLGGIQVVSEKPFQTGDILELALEIPGSATVRTVAKVIWCRPADQTIKLEFTSGVQFIPVFEEDLEKLKEYFATGV